MLKFHRFLTQKHQETEEIEVQEALEEIEKEMNINLGILKIQKQEKEDLLKEKSEKEMQENTLRISTPPLRIDLMP